MSTSDANEKPKPKEQSDGGDKNTTRSKINISSEAESGKKDFYENQTKQARALKKARSEGVRTSTHVEFGTPTIEGEGTLIRGGAPSPATIRDNAQREQEKNSGVRHSTEQTGTIIDYKIKQESESSFSLGMDYEDAGANLPLSKLGEFMEKAGRRATDPEGWKLWSQGEINKFAGIGAGLNEAKDETKAAVAAGWKALTDGTVVEFLSHPSAINTPVFKTVAGAFDAMSKDSNAVNKAFEALGQVVIKASEGYSDLPDAEKGKVIGKVMFGLINPEGSTEGAEAAEKIADRVAKNVDKTVLNCADETIQSLKNTAPNISNQGKQALYDYQTTKGRSLAELKAAGFSDNYMNAVNDIEIQNLAGAPGGSWEVLNEHPSNNTVRQIHQNACISAVGEMITNGDVKQEQLVAELAKYWPKHMLAGMEHPTANLTWLAMELKASFEFDSLDPLDPESIETLLNYTSSCATELKEDGKIAHAIVIDGKSEAGNVLIRDPNEGTRYEMTKEEFVKYWNGRVVKRMGE